MSRVELGNRKPQELLVELDAASGLVSLIREASSAQDAFESDYVAPLVAFADWVQALPACQEHHSDPCGLLRYAVQAGYFALRLADGVVFGAELGAEARRVAELESRRAAFLATLASPLAMAHEQLSVRSADGEPWSEFSIPAGLGPWSRQHGGRYVLAWRPAASALPRSLALWLAGGLLSPYWGKMRRDVALSAMASLCPEPTAQGQATPMERIVRQALASSAEVAKRAERARYRPPADVVVSSADELAAEARAPEPSRARGTELPPRERRSLAMPAQHAAESLAERAGPAQSELGLSGAFLPAALESLPAALRQLVEALAEDVRTKETVRRRVGWDEHGWLVLDQNLLGAYGMGPPASVAGTLKKARIAQDGNGRTLRIVEPVGELILPRSKAA